MRLKSLTLQGFKTFATKTEFTFDGDLVAAMTAISITWTIVLLGQYIGLGK